MIIIFLVFTLISLYLKTKESKTIQECIPFYIVSTISWISFILYLYLNSMLYLFITFEITSFLIMISLGKNLSRFFQLKFISFFVLSLMYIFEGVFQQDILYLYVLISMGTALTSTFTVDRKVLFPFILFNIFSLMKAREIIESPFAVTVFIIGSIIVLTLLLKNKLQGLTKNSGEINLLMWFGVFTFSIDLYFLLTIIVILLTITLLSNFKINGLNETSDILIFLASLIILIPFIKVSFPLAVIWLAVFTICLFNSKRRREMGVCHD